MQSTIFAYTSISNVIFKRFRLIYKGIASTPANATIDSMYLCQWSDPDVGDYHDDFAGCDTMLNLGYAYNANPTDPQYSQYGLLPPAVGYAFFQGPIKLTGNPGDTAIFNFRRVIGARNLPMTSFIYFAAGGRYSDPPFTYNGAVQWYQMLRGFPPTPQGPPDPPRVINPVTNQPTSFWLTGDPVAGTGWRDGILDSPGDRRYLLSSGSFRMAVGHTQEIVVAVVAGEGGTNIQNITRLRNATHNARNLYNTLFTASPPTFSVAVTYPAASNATVRIVADGRRARARLIFVFMQR
ncbi:MAG: hypothetical protein AAB393_10915, partial [Bacteroidota bacterium]